MFMTTPLRWTFAIPLALVACYEVPLYAYIDPGTGSMLVQGIIAAIAGAAVMLRLSWARIRSLFSRGPDAAR
jgi:hypothetical protein